jgi:hypothetical protein
MSGSMFRGMAACVLTLGVCGSSMAADSGAAMVYPHGAAWLNGAHVPASSAIFAGDLLQTRFDSSASINAPGSSIMISGDSLVSFEASTLRIEHGAVAVSTSKGIATTAGEVRVAPASQSWTEFAVTDTNGTVKIAARKGDLTVTDDKGTTTLAQGQETTRDEQSQSGTSTTGKNKKADAAAPPAAVGGKLNSKLAIGLGAAAIAGVTAWALVSTNGDDPVSPSLP